MKSQRDHAYLANRQMGRQREFICKAHNDSFEHVAIVDYAIKCGYPTARNTWVARNVNRVNAANSQPQTVRKNKASALACRERRTSEMNGTVPTQR
jgi:hypothetical protein